MPDHFCRFVALLIAIRKRKRKNGHFSCLVPMAYGCGTNGTKETRPTSPLQFAKQAKCFDVCNRATKDTQPYPYIPPDSLRGSWQSCFAPIISQWRINDLVCWARKSFSWWHLRICFDFFTTPSSFGKLSLLSCRSSKPWHWQISSDWAAWNCGAGQIL